MATASNTLPASYEEACANHRWEVPERYNIAADVCDRHPADKPAMVWEDWQGNQRRCDWGELQSLSARAANVLSAAGVQRGDRVAVVAPASPETAAVFFGTWKCGAILLSMSVLYGDEGIRHRLGDSQPRVLVTDSANASRMSDFDGEVLLLDDGLLDGVDDSFETVDTSADDPAQLYYSSGTTGLAKGILHAHRYILAHNEFSLCHDVRDGELFHGMGEWAWAAGIAPLLGPWRLGACQFVFAAPGRLRSRPAAGGAVAPRGDQRVHHAHRDAGDDGHRRRRPALPAEVPHRVLGRRAAQPGGDPLVSRAVRRHRARLLRADRVLPAVRQLPLHGGARGLDGPADARLGRADPRRGRAAGGAGRARGDLPARALQPPLPAGLLERRRGGARGRSAASGSTPRTPPSRTRTATSGTRAAPTT